MALSVILNWLMGLLPAVILRYGVYRRGLTIREAALWSVFLAVSLSALFTWVSFRAGVRPNMIPIVLWVFFSYWILRLERKMLE